MAHIGHLGIYPHAQIDYEYRLDGYKSKERKYKLSGENAKYKYGNLVPRNTKSILSVTKIFNPPKPTFFHSPRLHQPLRHLPSLLHHILCSLTL